MTFSVVQRSPKSCSVAELDAFERLVNAGREVNQIGLRARIKRACSVVWLQGSDGSPVGVGALKYPHENYRASIFKKASSREEPNKYELELGWIFLENQFRGQGLSDVIMKELLSASRTKSLYATVRENNYIMRTVLVKHGFMQEGRAYLSDEGDYKVVLYIKNDKVSGALIAS